MSDPGVSAARPDHAWNDPDGDGHDCADCAPDSVWKCDEAAHFDPRQVIRDVQEAMYPELERAARQRRLQRTDRPLA